MKIKYKGSKININLNIPLLAIIIYLLTQNINYTFIVLLGDYFIDTEWGLK